ncbi:MAG: hypothetical protein IPN74_10635 [Haliscomenobacter sp.]|nr:hypothetical protein [Haliscomenobacter sp.]MBK8878977.1 hypothetical protein [Haliscomenobacter sp.]
MKLLAGILALTVLFLSVQPAFALFVRQMETTCCGGCCAGEENRPVAGFPFQNDCDDQCNPFMSCCSCIHCSENLSISNPALPEFKGADLPSVREQVSCSFYADFWHPPRMA